MDQVNKQIKIDFLKKLLTDIDFNCYPEIDKKQGKNKVYRTRCYLTFSEHEYIILKALLDNLEEGMEE